MDEGVIKFTSVHQRQKLYFDTQIRQQLQELNSWRRKLFELDVIGCDLSRYGACYGNVSMRYVLPESIHYSFPKAPGYRAFLVTGTQTGNLEDVTEQHYARVYRYDHRKNRVWSEGPIEPSSESMTHGAIYDLPLELNIRYVIHIHAPQLWQKASQLGIPATAEKVAYGTPEMAAEVQRLFHGTDLAQKSILAMGGHQDGIIAFGATVEETSLTLLQYLTP
ncbi:class II aldolase/adducin family protein [Candidatus Woesearchaeota archaeon]|nr:class II aldolase/adducin family protein [Candidatus Woesearchaeota archaeon]